MVVEHHVIMYTIYNNRSMTAMIRNNCYQDKFIMCNENKWNLSNCNEHTTSDDGN